MMDAQSDGPDIRLLFSDVPTAGEIRTVAPGILWLRMPLPLRLNHVNIWLLDDDDGWTVIDTGVQHETTHLIWKEIENKFFRGKPLRRLLATHGHTDHCGVSSWMVQRYGVPFFITLTEWQAARLRVIDEKRPIAERTSHFASVHDCDPDMVQSFAQHRALMAPMLDPQPMTIEQLRAGDRLCIGGRDWLVIVAGGHADAHVSLYCHEEKILIAGDQILQRISPMIGVFPDRPSANPLKDYLTSFPNFRELSADTLVLPGHGLPFYGLHIRVDQLERHHHDRLTELMLHLDRPRTASSCTRHLFARAVEQGQARLALAETLAHLNYLIAMNRVLREIDDQERLSFSAVK
ncbi:MAG: MBL fold metallo-hydrolase [Hyphomicrobiaceae bacterium]